MKPAVDQVQDCYLMNACMDLKTSSPMVWVVDNSCCEPGPSREADLMHLQVSIVHSGDINKSQRRRTDRPHSWHPNLQKRQMLQMCISEQFQQWPLIMQWFRSLSQRLSYHGKCGLLPGEDQTCVNGECLRTRRMYRPE